MLRRSPRAGFARPIGDEDLTKPHPTRYVSEIDGDGLSESKRASEIAREDAFDNGRLTFEWHGHPVDLDVAE